MCRLVGEQVIPSTSKLILRWEVGEKIFAAESAQVYLSSSNQRDVLSRRGEVVPDRRRKLSKNCGKQNFLDVKPMF